MAILDEIKGKLEELALYKSQRDVELLEKQRIIDEVYSPEIKARVSEIEQEFAGRTSEATSKIASLEVDIRNAVVKYGASVKGSILHAVYAQGRTSWDTSALIGYAAAHPEMEQFKKVGEPSVSIRTAK